MSDEMYFSTSDAELALVEMRTVSRHPILQRCFVRAETASADRAWQCVAYDISSKGVGLALPARLPKGTLVRIKAFDLPRARSLQVRVVQAKAVDLVWFTGCELLTKLTGAELQVWRSGPIDWVAKKNP